jgi:hypothetical protein
VVEHFLGREEVVSSILTNGSLLALPIKSSDKKTGCKEKKADSYKTVSFLITNNYKKQ